MKTKLFVVVAAALLLAGPTFAQTRGTTTGGHVITSGGHTSAANNWGNHGWNNWGNRGYCRPYWRGGWGWGPSFSVGIGFPFYGGYYGYPYYGGYPGYGYGYGGYPYGGYYSGGYYGSGYYPGGASYYASRPVDGGGGYRAGSLVARVQERLARGGYYAGSVDGVMGPRTRSAIRAYERRHGLPVDGEIDRDLLATMGLA